MGDLTVRRFRAPEATQGMRESVKTKQDRSLHPLQLREQARLVITLGGVAFAGRARILVQLEQGWLFRARLGLCLAQCHQIAPEKAAAVDLNEAGQGHDQSPKRGHLCGGPLLFDLFRLQRMQVIRSALRMGGGGEDQAFVVLQGLQPVGDIGGVILTDLGGNFEIGTEEG